MSTEPHTTPTPRRGRKQRTRVRIAMFGAAAVVAAMIPLVASANLPPSTFEVDGNLVHAAGIDWDSSELTTLQTGVELASGKGDNSFGQGTKEDLTSVSVVTGSIPPNKSDLTRFYVADDKVGTDHYLYLAWERTATLGSANMDFEINKLAQPDLTTTGAKTLARSAGDLLVRYDFSNGGTTPTLSLVKWLTAGNGDAAGACFATNALPCWGAADADDALDGVNDNQVNLTGAGFADGATNTGTVAEPMAGGTLAPATFGEAAINLTDAGVFGAGDGCTSFGSAYLKSRSSSSFTAETKDFVAPKSVSITNCGNLVVKKVTVGGSGTFGFTTTSNTSDSLGSFNLTTPGGATNVDTKTFTGIRAGTYTVAEDAKTNWSQTSAVCDHSQVVTAIHVTEGTTVTCTFTNTLQVGSVTITKKDDSNPQALLSGVGFTLYNDVAPLSEVGGHGVLDTATSMTCTTVAGTCSITDVPVGEYWVVETTSKSGYTAAADQHLTVSTGSSTSLTFVDPREFKVITIVCKVADGSLYPSSVSLTGGPGSPKTSIGTGDTGAAAAAQLCTTANLGGATFSPKGVGSYSGSVNIPQ